MPPLSPLPSHIYTPFYLHTPISLYTPFPTCTHHFKIYRHFHLPDTFTFTFSLLYRSLHLPLQTPSTSSLSSTDPITDPSHFYTLAHIHFLIPSYPNPLPPIPAVEFCDFPSVFHDMDLPRRDSCPTASLPDSPSHVVHVNDVNMNKYASPLTPSSSSKSSANTPLSSMQTPCLKKLPSKRANATPRKRKKLHGELLDIIDTINNSFEGREQPSATKLKMISLAKDLDDFGTDKKRRVLMKQIEDMVFDYTMECINSK